MTVYFIRRKLDGAIKIGFTDRNPNQRLAELQNASGLELELLVAISGDRGHERALHDEFAAHRMFGEWFKAAPELTQLVEWHRWSQTPAGRLATRRHNAREKIATLLRDLAGTSDPDPFDNDQSPNDWAFYVADYAVTAALRHFAEKEAGR